MARACWLIDGRGIARKVRDASSFSNCQIKELGIKAHRECPNCSHIIDNSDVSFEWPGFPAGVKFDPTDIQILEHLAGKVGLPNSKSHILIDEFIPTLTEEQGICYAHPEDLPGVKNDGSSVHFFYKISNAYATGQRKRRKIDNKECSSASEEKARWHKTGKTKPVIDKNGNQIGWKKIMVLYQSLKGGSKRKIKADKAKWVMHQYHLGTEVEETAGEMVVAKIFFQQNSKQNDKAGAELSHEEPINVASGPRTPKMVTPQQLRRAKQSPISEAEYKEEEIPQSVANKNDEGNSLLLAGESQAVDEVNPKSLDEFLFCHEVFDTFAYTNDASFCNNELLNTDDLNSSNPFDDLNDIPLGTPPDFNLLDIQFGSQDSISSWLNRM